MLYFSNPVCKIQADYKNIVYIIIDTQNTYAAPEAYPKVITKLMTNR